MDNYKKIKPENNLTLEQKLSNMKNLLLDSDKCKQIAQKLKDYIKK